MSEKEKADEVLERLKKLENKIDALEVESKRDFKTLKSEKRRNN
jgi:hypothetical protein